MHYSTTQRIGKQLKLEINSAPLYFRINVCTTTLVYDTRECRQLKLETAAVIFLSALYYVAIVEWQKINLKITLRD